MHTVVDNLDALRQGFAVTLGLIGVCTALALIGSIDLAVSGEAARRRGCAQC